MVAQQAESETRRYAEHVEELDLRKYWLVLKRRWIPAFFVFSAAVALAVLAALAEEDMYRAEGKVLIKRDRSTALTGLDDEIGEVERLTREPLETQAELVRSLPVMEATVQALDLRTESGNPVDPSLLLKKVNVKPVPSTDLLEIKFQSEDPKEAAAVVNQVIESYRTQNIESNRAEAAAAREFIEDQLPATETQVLDVETKLRAFKERNSIVLLERETSEAVSVLSNLDRDMNNVEAELADIEAQLSELQGQLGVNVREAIALSSLNQSAGVQSALTDVQNVQANLAELRSRYQDEHPEVVIEKRRLAESEALLRERIQEVLGQELTIPVDSLNVGRLQLGELRQNLIANLTRLEVSRIGLANRRAQLVETRAQYLQQLDSLPGLEKTQRQLERQLQAAQTTYETLLTQLQEIRVVENQTVGNVRIVSLAEVPRKPVSSDRKLYLAAGGFVGLLLAIGTAFLLDLLDSSVKTIKEIKELYGYTLLGVIPFIKGVGPREEEVLGDAPYPRLLVDESPHPGVQEAYQVLQANLKFLKSDTELKTVVITSAVPGEGKSEVSVNLAAALAQVGRRVLLIDADMRCPRQHHALKVLNVTGLSHVITGQATVKSAIQMVTDNLDVLTAGVVPPNPLALLDSKRMESLLHAFARHYDMVIVDAPPMVGYADASILGKMADGILLVARPRMVDYAQGRIAKETLLQSRQQVLGLVANGVNPANEPDGHFYYLRQEMTYSNENAQRVAAAAATETN
ncbi:MAG: polysaccharide biosynthesis tyrosine autokinase [Cyanobacteria bacterium P01_F01_bin.86]